MRARRVRVRACVCGFVGVVFLFSRSWRVAILMGEVEDGEDDGLCLRATRALRLAQTRLKFAP